MRTVLKGSKRKLYRLQPEDLPTDLNLTASFWQWVDFSGFDLSAYNMMDMDIVGSPVRYCLAHDVILPEGTGIYFLESRYVDWAGARIPKDVTFLAHDLVVEVLNQHTAPVDSDAARAIDWVKQHVSAAYTNSWNTAIYHLIHNMGLTRKQVWDYFSTYAFGGYPRLLWKLKQGADQPILLPDPPTLAPNHIKITGLPEGTERWLERDWPFKVVGQDRYALARQSEPALAQRYPDLAPWRCWYKQLSPNIIGFACPERLLTDSAKAQYNWWGH